MADFLQFRESERPGLQSLFRSARLDRRRERKHFVAGSPDQSLRLVALRRVRRKRPMRRM